MDDLKDWLRTFGRVVIRPLPSTFLEEAEKANRKFASAVGWLAFVVVVVHLYLFVVTRVPDTLLAALATVFLVPITFLFFVFCVHLIYRRLFRRKEDHYEELVYLLVGIFVPFVFVNLLVGVYVPSNIPLYVALIYTTGVMVVAVGAITKLKLWQAALTIMLSLTVASLAFFCIGAFIVSLIGTVPRML